MKLSMVQIVNFRSLKDVTINFAPPCVVLVGINESGKSNILRALSFLAEENIPTKADLREISPGEHPPSEAYIKFIFDFEDGDTEQIYDKLNAKVLGPSTPINLLLRNARGVPLTLRELCSLHEKGVFRVDLMKGQKYPAYFRLPEQEKYKIESRWKKVSKQCPANFTVVKDGSETGSPLKTFALIDANTYKNINEPYLEDISPEETLSLVGSEIANYVQENLPQCIFWQYNEQNYLPPKINLPQFSGNPEICEPLRNMFELAGIKNVKAEFDKEKAISAHGTKNLLRRVAVASTNHLHDVWKEYKSVSFELVPNGDNIDIGVKDQYTSFEFSQRSDGFKRFVTFLLMISAKSKTKLLENALLLIDEPDTSLHPSGAKFLRDELIKISERNRVVFSTHSIHMIDKDNIGRHLIVKKDNEVSSITRASDSNVVDEEVLYNAIGYSIFESLKKKNILFEGWRDKRLFQVALSKVPKQYKRLRKTFNAIGFCHATGVKDIRTITPLLELANRDCLILSDDDEISKEKQSQFMKIRGCGTWKRYSEIWPEVGAVTGEDFIRPQVFRAIIDDIRKEHTTLPDLPDESLSHPKGKLYAFTNWLSSGGITKPETTNILASIKDRVFEQLKPSQIEDRYYVMLGKLGGF
jgi:energy-coupling factor transporter ATP-binding protein EcfA2